MKRPFTSLTVRALLGQITGLIITAIVGLLILYFGIRAQVYDNIRTSGLAAVEMLENVLKEDPDLIQIDVFIYNNALNLAIQKFVADFPSVTRMSVVDYRLRVVADTDNLQTGDITDQNALIEIMRNPREDVAPLLYTRSGQNYLRVSQAIHGSYDPVRDSDVIGAVSVDMSMSQAERRINIIFFQAATALILLFAFQIGLQYLFLRNSVLTPLRGLMRVAQQIGRGQLDTRAPIDIINELGDMGHAINNMAASLEKQNAERKQAEEKLRESEERFKGAFDFSAIGMSLVSLDGRWLEANPALCQIVGYSEKELLTKTFQEITHPDDLETDLAYVRQILAGEILAYKMEKRYFHKSGHVVWVLLSVSLVRDIQNQPLYFV